MSERFTPEVCQLLLALNVAIPKDLPYPSDYEIGFVNGFTIRHQNYYYVLKGKFPLVHARILHSNGITESNYIREMGRGYNTNPDDCMTSDKLEALSDEHVKEYQQADAGKRGIMFSKWEEEHKALYEHTLANVPLEGYLTTYHIDVIEGLVFMIKYIIGNEIVTNWGYI